MLTVAALTATAALLHAATDFGAAFRLTASPHMQVPWSATSRFDDTAFRLHATATTTGIQDAVQ
jgi:hypothetical protein